MAEGVRVMTEDGGDPAGTSGPMQIGLLNLMPNKIKTELQMARLLGASPSTGRTVAGPVGQPQAEEHVRRPYDARSTPTWEDVRRRKFDGFIVTGTPVETIPFEEVRFVAGNAADFRMDAHATSTRP